jgi:hypothetical protein
MTIQVVANLSNRKSLCIGEITTKEAADASVDDPSIDGSGLYLVSVNNDDPSGPGTVLAKFVSEHAALTLANFFRAYGSLEKA